MICQVCAGESIRLEGDKEIIRTCRECLAESLFNRGFISDSSALKFCSCYAGDHK